MHTVEGGVLRSRAQREDGVCVSFLASLSIMALQERPRVDEQHRPWRGKAGITSQDRASTRRGISIPSSPVGDRLKTWGSSVQ